MKKCSKCGDVKEYVLFNKHSGKKDGYASNCKECDKQSRIDRAEKIREYNKSESGKKRTKTYKEKNKEKSSEYQKKYNSNLDPEVKRKRDREYMRKRMDRDFIFKLCQRLSSQLHQALNSGGFKKLEKKKRMEDILGCSWEYFVEYMRGMYMEGMTDNNNTRYGWHIDHILPKSLAYGKSVEKLYELFHYSNLRPLWGDENLKKSNKI
jgi:hypothetical protein